MYEKWLYNFVIPDLIRNPVFSTWISAGVYPDGIRGGNDKLSDYCKEVLETLHYSVVPKTRLPPYHILSFTLL